MVLDYVLSALDGMRSDKYVNNCVPCANNSKYFIIDVNSFEYTKANTDTSTSAGKETVFFNFTATISGYLPDAIYYCFFVPENT
jgi:hypothetical protein